MEEKIKETKSFAQELNIDQIVWIFLIGSVIGTIYEEILCLFQFGEWQSRRGLIYGPVNPVYGVGFVLLVLTLHKIKKTYNLILVGGIVGGFFEYAVWALQRAFFKTESWNYKTPWYINDRPLFEELYWGGTSFFHALGWGILAMFGMKIIYPYILRQLAKIDYKIGHVLTIVIIVFISLDSLITMMALKRQEMRHLCENNSDQCKLPNALDRLLDRIYTDEYIELIFPNMNYDLEESEA